MDKSELMAEAAKRRAARERVVDVEEERVKLVVFSLSGEWYAFQGSDVKEILSPMNIYPVPGSPDYMLGLINVRGDIESVIAINQFMGLPVGDATPKSRIAMAEKGGVRSGILVDSVEDVADFPISSIKPPLSTLGEAGKEFITGETMLHGRNVTLLDVGRMFERLRV